MKTFTTIMAAALIAGSAGLAMAQSGGGGASGGSDVNPDRLGKGADQNPSGPGAGPAAGTKEAVTPGQARTGTTGAMKTAPVSGAPQGTTQSKDSTTPSQAPTGTSK